MKSDMGRAKNRGSNNGRIFVSGKEPLIPINKDMWINPDALDTIYVKKSSSTARASTTTLVDDPHLTMSLPKNGLFDVSLNLVANSPSSNPDIKLDWNTSGLTLEDFRLSFGPNLSMTSSGNCNINTLAVGSFGTANIFGASYGGASSIFENFLVSTSSSAGILTLRWAQYVSNASAVTVWAGSYIKITQLAGDVSLLKWYSENDSEWKFMI